MIGRFRKAEKIMSEGRYYLEAKGRLGYYFKVLGDSDEEHSVIISEDKISCTCPEGSFWGVKRYLPCSHILVCFGSMMHVQGPLIMRKWWKDSDGKT